MTRNKNYITKLLKDGIVFAVWLAVITFPLMVIKVNTIKDTVEWRWLNALWVLLSGYAGYIVWMYALRRKELGKDSKKDSRFKKITDDLSTRFNANKRIKQTSYIILLILTLIYPFAAAFLKIKPTVTVFVFAFLGIGFIILNKLNTAPLAETVKIKTGKKYKYFYFSGLAVLICAFPLVSQLYDVNIMINVLIYVLLGLGLNIVVGLGGILNLGHAAFFAVGAYSYALLNYHFGLDFWVALPIGGILAVLFGIILSVPVLRLKGDYLAIVTLAFGEIIRIVLENWDELSFGPSGIANIPKPYIPFLNLSYMQTMQFTYYIMIVLTILAVIMSNRLKYSRIGRALIAMREDETASNAMGINTTKMKIISFALGAFWAGIAGVMFAAKQAYINPVSFTIWNSIIVLCIVVLGGMGSIKGVIVAAFVLTVLPEAFRTFQDYRMVLFGAVLVVMMVFKPEGLLPEKRKIYRFDDSHDKIYKGSRE
jgi:branched-chain amino acid transport system permease protein